MTVELTAAIIRILNSNDETAGTGFVLTNDGLLVTCAHVVRNAGAKPGETIRLVFHITGTEATALVEPDGWREPNAEDVAILRLEGSLPEGVKPLPLTLAEDCSRNSFISFGYPLVGRYQEAHIRGTIDGLINHPSGWPMLQISSTKIGPGSVERLWLM